MIVYNQNSTVFPIQSFYSYGILVYFINISCLMQHTAQNHKKAIQKLRIILKVNVSYNKWAKQMRNTKQRYNVLKEWAKTQASYIQDLKIIEQDIQLPLKQAQLISDQQDRLLFPNMRPMIYLSETMLACIQATIKEWTPNHTLIGQNLMAFYKFFMIYRDYCNNFMKAQEIIKTLRQNPKVLKIQQKLKLKEIASYTIKPVQRPPKYQLLLREYHKALPTTHKDYNIIKQTIQKYHEVNELNNQSMDRQFRADIMIKLDKKYGNVISSRTGREYLKEFTCKCGYVQCTIYAFNDMLLFVQKKGKDNDQIYKRIYLDWTSYVSFKTHYKHFNNMVFICGINKSAHLEFENIANTQNFHQNISRTIKILLEREQERRTRFIENQVRRKNLAKFRVTKWDKDVQNRIVYKPKLEIKVISTLLSKSDLFFFLVEFKVINPYSSAQTILLSFDKIVSIYEELKKKYSQIEFPRVKMTPQQIGMIEATTNKNKLTQYRAFIIEQFLNFVFRIQELYTFWKTIAMQIGINFDLFRFAASEDFTCTCNSCIQMKEKQAVIYYRHLLKPPKSHSNKFGSKSSVEIQSVSLNQSKSEIQEVSDSRTTIKPCSTYIFNVFNSIKQAEKYAKMSFPDKMLSLQIEMGQINYTCLVPEQVPFSSNISFKVYLLSIQQQYIEITLKQDKYVRQILDEIAQMSSLDTIYDWNLYIYRDKDYTRIPNDEKILDLMKKWEIDIEKIEEQIDKDSFIMSRIDNIMKWGEQFWGGKKGKIFMKKSLHFEYQTQMNACNTNKQRYHFLIGEAFGRIKYQSMYLSYDQTVQMCAFYLLKKQFSKVKHWTQQNIDLSPLKQLLPPLFHPYTRKDKFRKELLDCIRSHYSGLEAHQDSRNAIEFVYIKILSFLRDNQEWQTLSFKMTTYKGQQLNDVILGISCNLLTVRRKRDRNILLSIEMQRLKYKTSAQSIFIYQEEKIYRYDGRESQTIRQLIETYLAYAALFKSGQ